MSYSFRISLTSSYVALATPLCMSVVLFGVGLDDAHVRERVAFLQRGHGAHEQDDARLRRDDILHWLVQIVGDRTDLPALDDVGVAIHGRPEHAVVLRGDGQ